MDEAVEQDSQYCVHCDGIMIRWRNPFTGFDTKEHVLCRCNGNATAEIIHRLKQDAELIRKGLAPLFAYENSQPLWTDYQARVCDFEKLSADSPWSNTFSHQDLNR